jgi:GNAT superfamily N-acetyltransferase
MNATLPQGWQMRPVTLDDLPTATELFNAEWRWLTGNIMGSIDDFRAEWESPFLNLPTDTMAIFLPDGKMAAYGEFWDQREPHVSFFGYTALHPDHQMAGLDEQVMAWMIERARENIAKAPDGARVTLQRSFPRQYTRAKETLAGLGFAQVRSYYRMMIDLPGPPPEPVLPEGILIRGIQGDDEHREAVRAVHESFKDHFGHTDEPFEAYYRRIMYFNKKDPYYDPSLWFIALDGEEISGASLCKSGISEDPELGWVGTLGVRRPWRKRGIGFALLQYSFCELYRRGKPRVGLGVDATSLTGATRLYERAGMRVTQQFDAFEFELRPGKDLTMRELAEAAASHAFEIELSPGRNLMEKDLDAQAG